MTTRHHTYPHPTIAEALCEIHFRLGNGQQWRESFAEELFDRIKTEYPSMEPIREMAVQIDINPSAVGHKILPSRVRMRFKHASRPLMLQLVENILTINVLPPYPGWDSMAETVLEAWERTRAVLAPPVISRIGLRYINRMQREQLDVVGDWIRPNDYIPTVLLRSQRNLFSRVQAQLDGQNRIMVTLGEQDASLVLDIDRIREEELGTEPEKVRRAIEALHDDVWSVFARCQGKKLEAYLHQEERVDEHAS